MTNREQLVEHEKRASPLSGREIEEADERSSTTAKVVHEAIRLEGTIHKITFIPWLPASAGMTYRDWSQGGKLVVIVQANTSAP